MVRKGKLKETEKTVISSKIGYASWDVRWKTKLEEKNLARC